MLGPEGLESLIDKQVVKTFKSKKPWDSRTQLTETPELDESQASIVAARLAHK